MALKTTKTTTAKKEVTAAKVVKTPKAKKAVIETAQIAVFDMSGKEVKQLTLPAELFAGEINKNLVAQYLRVYAANQRQGNASTKSRSEVVGSTRKIYRQKGTGNARHGARKAPIFVGGGVQAGPKPKDFSLSMNKKQKRLALIAALTQKAQDGVISGLVNAAVDMKIKTKDISSFLTKAGYGDKKTLIVLPEVKKNGLVLSTRNIPHVTIAQASTINPFMILTSRHIIFTEDAISTLSDHFLKSDAS